MTKPWVKHENTIHDLYKIQGKTLEETMNIMKTQYGFDASTRAYRAKFKKWGWTKYNKQKQFDHRPQITPSSVISPYDAPLMTPGPSSEGISNTRGPAIARTINSPGSMLDGFRGVSTPSSSTMYNPENPNEQVNLQNSGHFVRQSFPNPQLLASPPPQRIGGMPRWQGYNPHPQQQQTQQQRMPFRPILPAIHQNGQHQTIHVDIGDHPSSTFHALLTPESPASASRFSYQSIDATMNNIKQLRDSGRLNERHFSIDGQYLTAFESVVQSSAPQVSQGFRASPEEIRDFCRICAIFVQVDADTTGIVPHEFEHAVSIALRSPEPAGMIGNVVRSHQRQLQRQDGTGLAFPPWVSVWVSACQQGRRGNSAELKKHLDVLSNWIGSQVDVYRYLGDLIPEPDSLKPYSTPESCTDQLPSQDIWDQ
ncbi:hypothetical protein N0V93_002906 [Gnomoniopsis smithogilvyi]|uniref:Clr5 domain-containing protein n=1 Tax=Gnomoniopsis smithogilvyi TaxID=1191159 RepID=A0A9W8YXM3_9PEZI|nr:hypothetical protein N0V93_002906 [Gnomoniopsis smithogilvyi]